MTISQISVFVENRQGKLVDVVNALAAAKVDIRAMSIADTQDFGILRLIVSDAAKAQEALADTGFVVSVTQVIGVAVKDEPGGLAKVIELLSENGINIEYMYAFITVSKQFAYVVLRVDDTENVEKFLTQHGISLVSEEDIQKL